MKRKVDTGYNERLFSSTLGRSHRVKRGHPKGFDYEWLTRVVAEYFDVVEVYGRPFSRLPPSLNFTVGTVGRRKGAVASPKR